MAANGAKKGAGKYQITHLKVIGVGGRGAGGSCPVPRFPADGALLPLEFRDEHHPKRPVGSFEFQMHGPCCRWVGFRCCRLPFVVRGDVIIPCDDSGGDGRAALRAGIAAPRAVQPSAAAGPPPLWKGEYLLCHGCLKI